jgi:hypothetical protein
MELHGVVNGAYSNHHDRLTEINTRIYERVIPSTALRPAYDVRPISSKYATMPILESRPTPTVPIAAYQNFSTETVFNPGNGKAPWRGWAERVNLESSLRNQFFAHQRNDRAEYVPDSRSDLYKVTIDSRDNVTQPNPYLFDNGATNFAPMNPNPNDLGRLTFENSTRYQLRTLNCTHDGFCTGEGGPTIEPVTNYIPQEQLDKKRKEKEQQRQVSHIAEGFSGGRDAANETVKPPSSSSEFATFIPRATASSNAREHLTMRRQ